MDSIADNRCVSETGKIIPARTAVLRGIDESGESIDPGGSDPGDPGLSVCFGEASGNRRRRRGGRVAGGEMPGFEVGGRENPPGGGPNQELGTIGGVPDPVDGTGGKTSQGAVDYGIADRPPGSRSLGEETQRGADCGD